MSAAGQESLETFRDPAGSLRIEEGRVLRTVRPEYAGTAVTFLESAIARRWMAQRRLIPTRKVDSRPNGEILLEHERVSFPTYPWEWTPGQWFAAATLTLDLVQELIDEGYILKDATPLNILFDGPKPIFVDVLSIEPREAGDPLWLAYGQFVRTFLLPLAAQKYLGWPLSNSLQRRDGYEPADLYPALSSFTRWWGPCRSLVTLPFLLEKRKIWNPKGNLSQSPEVASAVLKRTLKTLRRLLNKLVAEKTKSRWSEYPESADHYSSEDHRQKKSFIKRTLEWIRPESVLDIGANTGTYSRIATDAGARVVAWDTDVAASEKNWSAAFSNHLPILSLVADVARPTPAAGWRNRETLALLDRARKSSDCVMALGILHHLLLAEQIPLSEIASLLGELTRRWVIIEWIPSTDIRFRDLLRGRDHLYGHLNEEAFLSAFRPYFSTVARERLGNGRVLYVLDRLSRSHT